MVIFAVKINSGIQRESQHSTNVDSCKHEENFVTNVCNDVWRCSRDNEVWKGALLTGRDLDSSQ